MFEEFKLVTYILLFAYTSSNILCAEIASTLKALIYSSILFINYIICFEYLCFALSTLSYRGILASRVSAIASRIEIARA